MSDINNTVESEYIVKKEDESEVRLEAQMVVPLQSRCPTSASVEVPVIVRLDPTSFDLPNDWVVEQRYRPSPKYAKRSDKVFSIPPLMLFLEICRDI